MRVLARLGQTVVVVLAGLAVLAVVLVALGWRPVVLLSGSMSPTAPTGSLVVVAPTPGEQVGPGDVVTVVWPGASVPVTHRVVAVDRDDTGALLATTRGDANDDVDQWRTRLDGETVLTARAVLPGAGTLLTGRGPRLALGVLGVAGGLLGLVAVWRPASRQTRGDALG